MKLFRITNRRFAGKVLSGKGADLFGGRWSSPGHPVIYCASSVESALAELTAWGSPTNVFEVSEEFALATVNVPDHVSRLNVRRSDLPHVDLGGIDYEKTRARGDQWLQDSFACMLVVPSRITPDTFVYLINPRHRDFEDFTVAELHTIQQFPGDVPGPLDKRQIFLCHASEDKDDIVRPVKEALFSRNINSWLAEAELTLGDSITNKVNKGLGEAEYVVVFISPAFVKKPWPRKELDAALNREARTGRKVVIPIVIHYPEERVDYSSFLPIAEDKLYGVWDGNPDKLAEQIQRAIRQDEG
jgi:RES domain-containing protein